jgi:signal transduction histidine kinase
LSPQTGSNFLLIGTTLLSLLVASYSVAKNVKKQVFYIWIVGLWLGSLGTILAGISFLYFTDVVQVDLTGDPFLLNRPALVGYAMYFLAILCQPLLFCSMRMPRSAFIKTVLSVVALFCIFIFANKLLATNNSYFLRLMVTHGFITGIFIWLTAELLLLKREESSVLVHLMLLISAVFVFIHLYWLTVIALTFAQVEAFSLSIKQMNDSDLHFRFVRSSLYIFLEATIFLYWLQNYSSLAVFEAQRKARIQELLAEQEKLISHLINTRSLVETGALSAGIAHELNQFLARIQLNAEEGLLSLSHATKMDNARASLARICDSVSSASKVIIGIKRLFAKSNEGFAMVHIDALIAQTVRQYLKRAAEAKVVIEVSLNVGQSWMLSDTLIRQVLGNLISNALDSLVSVVGNPRKIVLSSFIRDNRVCIEVADNGPGVMPAKVENLFALFFTTKVDGSGVGLWLSKHILEEHGGRIVYRSSDCGGARFAIEIPQIKHRTASTN